MSDVKHTPAVIDLIWEAGEDEEDPSWELADTIVGRYQIVLGELVFVGVEYEDLVQTTLAETGDFKAIAQEHFRQVVLSALRLEEQP